MITEADIYETLSDMIADIYEWSSDEKNEGKAIQYVMGLNDMARNIAEKLREYDRVNKELRKD